jgi:hypothetical protein
MLRVEGLGFVPYEVPVEMPLTATSLVTMMKIQMRPRAKYLPR